MDLLRNYNVKKDQEAIEARNSGCWNAEGFEIERETLNSTIKMLNDEVV